MHSNRPHTGRLACIYIHTSRHAHTHSQAHTDRKNTYIYTRTHVYTHTCVRTHTHMYAHTHTHTHTYTHTHTHTNRVIHTHKYVHTTHTHIHTHYMLSHTPQHKIVVIQLQILKNASQKQTMPLGNKHQHSKKQTNKKKTDIPLQNHGS